MIKARTTTGKNVNDAIEIFLKSVNPISKVSPNADGNRRRSAAEGPKSGTLLGPVDRLVNGRSLPWFSLATKAACPFPDSLHQLDGWRKEPGANYVAGRRQCADRNHFH